MVTTNFETPAGHASLTNITSGFQMFPNGWVKFVMAFQMVFFAYQAIEFVGITTSETANPRQVLPKAIKEIPIRIVIFYVGALVALMAIFPWQQLPVNKSPFVTVFQMVGIKWAGLINFVVLTAAAIFEFHPLFNRSSLLPDCKRNTKQQSHESFETE